MTAVRTLSLLGAVVMVVAIATALATGEFFAEGSNLWALPWGKVTLIDLYVGLAFFGAWIAYREDSWLVSLAWWAGLVVLGSLTAAIYLTIASFNSNDMAELLVGKKQEYPCEGSGHGSERIHRWASRAAPPGSRT